MSWSKNSMHSSRNTSDVVFAIMDERIGPEELILFSSEQNGSETCLSKLTPAQFELIRTTVQDIHVGSVQPSVTIADLLPEEQAVVKSVLKGVDLKNVPVAIIDNNGNNIRNLIVKWNNSELEFSQQSGIGGSQSLKKSNPACMIATSQNGKVPIPPAFRPLTSSASKNETSCLAANDTGTRNPPFAIANQLSRSTMQEKWLRSTAPPVPPRPETKPTFKKEKQAVDEIIRKSNLMWEPSSAHPSQPLPFKNVMPKSEANNVISSGLCTSETQTAMPNQDKRNPLAFNPMTSSAHLSAIRNFKKENLKKIPIVGTNPKANGVQDREETLVEQIRIAVQSRRVSMKGRRGSTSDAQEDSEWYNGND